MIVLTGKKHVGKTTVLKRALPHLHGAIYGVISESFGTGYWAEDLATGERMILASTDPKGIKVKGYYFRPEALRFVENALKRKGDILIYDEIGHVEMRGFIDIFSTLRDRSILIVKEDVLDAFRDKIENYRIITVTKENRGSVLHDLIALCNDLF
jgi:nucleoside-triphosphatase